MFFKFLSSIEDQLFANLLFVRKLQLDSLYKNVIKSILNIFQENEYFYIYLIR